MNTAQIFIHVKSIVLWCATLIEDVRGQVSSKRVFALWAMWIFDKSVSNPDFNDSLIWPQIVLIAGLVGLTLPEWFSNLKNK